MKKNRLLCFIESPLQLLNLSEYLESIEYMTAIVYVRTRPGAETNKLILESMANNVIFFNKRKVKVHFLYNFHGLHFFKNYRYFKKFKSEVDTSYNQVVIGDLRAVWMRRFARAVHFKKIICLDDGTASYEILREMIIKKNLAYRESIIWPTNHKQLKVFIISFIQSIQSVFYNIILKKTIKISDLEFFSSFFKPDEFIDYDIPIIPNKYEKLKSKLSNKNKSDEIWLFGSPLGELGIIEVETEIQLLKHLFDMYDPNYSSIIYFSHRYDSETKLEHIRDLGYEVVKNEQPAEVFLTLSSILPEKIIACNSSILLTFSNLVDIDLLYNMHFDQKLLNLSFKKEALFIRKEIESINIETIFIDI